MERKPVVIAQEALEKEAAVCEQIKALWASRGRTPRAFVDTYGCQQNEADSERIRGMLRASGYEIVDTEEGADCIVINTCAIREHAETRVYGNVGALVHTKARHPEQKIFLCGCMMGQPQVVERIKNSYRHVGQYRRGHPRRALVKPQGVGVDHVRLQQFLLVLHRAVCPRTGAVKTARGDSRRSQGPHRGGL